MKHGKPAKRYSQAARVHDIIRMIESRHGMSLDDLSEETGVTRRTIHRDLNAIHDAGYPLVSEKVNGVKVYRFITQFKDIPPVSFTLDELATLYFVRGETAVLNGTPFASEIDSIFSKIRSVLPPKYSAHLDRISGAALSLAHGRHDYRNSCEILKELRNALIYQKRISIGYLPSGRKTPEQYRLDPYTLIFYKGGLYLTGFAHNRGALRTFALDRIKTLATEKERFEIPSEYNPDSQLRDAFGIVREDPDEVIIRFSPVGAHSVRGRIWHENQREQELPDGGMELAFFAGGRMEILSWVLSFGEHAEVIEPGWLRERVKASIEQTMRIYSQKVNS